MKKLTKLLLALALGIQITPITNAMQKNTNRMNQEDPERCGICLEPFLEGEAITPEERMRTGEVFTTCGHQFHDSCLNPWLTTHNTCPICRSVIVQPAALTARRALNINVGIREGYTPDSQLWNDICINNLAGVQAAIIAGANVNAIFHGQSPLHRAVTNNNITVNDSIAIIQELLAAPGIDVNIRDHLNETPLHSAIQFQNEFTRNFVGRNYYINVIQLLLRTSEIAVNAQNRNLETPLLIAIRDNQNEIVQMLLNTPGIDVNRAGMSQRTPLIMAIVNGNNTIIHMLLAADGIDVNASDHIGETPLHKAIWRLVLHPRNDNDINLIQALLNSPEINIEKASNNWMTPLMFASAFGKTEAVRLLLDHGANKNAVLPAGPYAGYTSLHYAAANGNKGIVQILLDAEADATIAASDGKTPEQMAILGNHPEIAELIKNHIERN